MAIISDGFNTYVERGGKRELLSPQAASMAMDGDDVFRWDGKTGVLELSMSQQDINTLIDLHRGLPIARMTVPCPMEQPIVENVKEIRPLPRKDGTFFLKIEKPAEPRNESSRNGEKSFFAKFFPHFR